MAAPYLLKDAVLTAPLRLDATGRDGGASPEPGGSEPSAENDPTRFGLWLLLGTISMLFIGFTSALLVRRASSDWVPLSAPPLLWINTLILTTSSITLESARRRFRAHGPKAAGAALLLTGLLGALFVTGQLG